MAWVQQSGAAAIWNGRGEELLDEAGLFLRDEDGRAELSETASASATTWTRVSPVGDDE